MAIDLERTLFWARKALRSDEEILPDDEIEDIAKSSVRRLLMLYPLVKEVGGSDLALLEEEDFEAFSEASGYLVAARWIVLPRPEGDELVTRLKIGQLEEAYKVPDVDDLLAAYREECSLALRSISFIAEAFLEAYLSGRGRPKIVVAGKTRAKAQLDPNGAGALAMLFSPRQTELFGEDFSNPVTGGEW